MFDRPSILPPNHTVVEAALEQAVRKGKPDLTPITTLMNPDTCPAHLLGWLAWAFSVDFWDPNWNEKTKRTVISQSITVHRRKGTIGAVRRALDALGYDITLVEWFDTGAIPHTFRVLVNIEGSTSGGANLSPDVLDEVKAVIENVKPVRSHFDVAYNISITSVMGCAVLNHAHLRAEAPVYFPPVPVAETTIHTGTLAWTRLYADAPAYEAS